jgi:RNA polymerase sigma factor (TIGR02999 family)
MAAAAASGILSTSTLRRHAQRFVHTRLASLFASCLRCRLPYVALLSMEPRVQNEPSALSFQDAPTPELFAALYGELHRLAESHLRRGGSELGLSTTTLLHEAYLDLSSRAGLDFPDRSRFLGYAARAMRGIVIDYARRSRAQKRGGGAFEITLSGELAAPTGAYNAEELSRLSDALDELGALEPALAELVDLHYFCGYSLGEIAALRDVSERTAQRDFRKARLLLQHALLEDETFGTSPAPRAED